MKLNHLRFRLHQANRALRGLSVPMAMVSAPTQMLDGINADAAWIAAHFPNLAYVGGYDTGTFAWTAAEWALFPAKTNKVHIVTNATVNDGDVLDWETGNEGQGSPHDWIVMRKTSPTNPLYMPTIYCDTDTVESVRVNTAELILGQDYDLWVADWTGNPHELTYPTTGKGPDVVKGVYSVPVVQYLGGADNDMDDRDAVYDTSWPHRTAPVDPPPPPPSPVRNEADGTMTIAELATERNTSVAHLVAVSNSNMNAKNRVNLSAYMVLFDAFGIKMPKGLVYYTSNN